MIMMEFLDVSLSDELVQSVLPNNLVSVDGEVSLADAVSPYMADALQWLRDALFGDVPCPESARDAAVRTALLRAVADAVPALDVVVTPSGFAVVSSSSMAPASKERVQRLVDNLKELSLQHLVSLQSLLLQSDDWRASQVGSIFCSISLSRLRDVLPFRKYGPDLMSLYFRVHDIAAAYESAMAREFLGHKLMTLLRTKIADGSLSTANYVVGLLRGAVTRFVARVLEGTVPPRPDKAEVWFPAEAILDALPGFPELHEVWLGEMGESFKVQPFVNSRKGGYFF